MVEERNEGRTATVIRSDKGKVLLPESGMLRNTYTWAVGRRLRGGGARFWLILAVVLFCCAVCGGQETASGGEPGPAESLNNVAERVSSAPVGRSLYEIAYELSRSEQLGTAELEQAITLLEATAELDDRANYVLDDMIRLVALDGEGRYSKLMRQLLLAYVDDRADLDVVRSAVGYLMSGMSLREEREQLLGELFGSLGPKNKVVGSELATELGLLLAEKADSASAVNYFILAYNNNNYNRLAFGKLVELIGEQLTPAIHLEHLRLILRRNPLDIEAALVFAGQCEQYELYETAVEAYKYCADLFRHLYPAEQLPAAIYLPWAMSSYNTERQLHNCLRIASEVGREGRFDILLGTIAAKATLKMGETEQGNAILKLAESQALALVGDGTELGPDKQAGTVNSEQMAWFYCFGVEDANRAVLWANKAYSSEPNSAVAAGLLAYAVVLNGQTDWPKILIDKYKRTQISELALAQIQLAQGQKDSAFATLKSAISKDPGTLAAESARELMTEQGGQYIPAVDADVALGGLKSQFAERIAPRFTVPGRMVEVGLKLHGSRFSYGSEFEGRVSIKNNSSEPVFISDDAMLAGEVRIDAAVSGDIEAQIPNLVSIKVSPSFALEPGDSYFVPVRLETGRLREVLVGHPQASLAIEFTVFVDPVVGEDGEVRNRIADIEPGRATVERVGVKLTRRYLQNRLDSLKQGRQSQKVKTGVLFAGLLKEQELTAGQEAGYELMYADWMGEVLRSALARNLADDDWVVRAQTMASMAGMPLDYELTRAASRVLNEGGWAERLIAVYVLAKSGDGNFQKVLEWTAKTDSSEYVRRMAGALGGAAQTKPSAGQ